MTFKLVGATLMAAALTLSACGDDAATTSAAGSDSQTTTPVDGQDGADDPVNRQRFWIRPDLVDCEGVAPQKCMQIAESEGGDYEFFYDAIEGFTFTEGTSYVIDVTVEEVEDPPADGSSLAFSLIEIVEETKASN